MISPERAASIFFRNAERAEELASALRLTAADCKRLGVADIVVPEPEGGAHTDPAEAARMLRNLILRELLQVQTQSPAKLVKSRYKRFRYLGGRTSILRGIFSRRTAQIQSLLQGAVGGRR
ncbi:hypothetical protein M1N79_02015 [Dehalococcoidia bacterium]|nr:hypothetical protein [Dehalococcoidia bacterium]